MIYRKIRFSILKSELSELINMLRDKKLAFEPGTVEYYYQKYKQQKARNSNNIS